MTNISKYFNEKTGKPLQRIKYGKHYWNYHSPVFERDIHGTEIALKHEGLFVMFVKFRTNPTAYLVYTRKAKGHSKESLVAELKRGDPYGKW